MVQKVLSKLKPFEPFSYRLKKNCNKVICCELIYIRFYTVNKDVMQFITISKTSWQRGRGLNIFFFLGSRAIQQILISTVLGTWLGHLMVIVGLIIADFETLILTCRRHTQKSHCLGGTFHFGALHFPHTDSHKWSSEPPPPPRWNPVVWFWWSHSCLWLDTCQLWWKS